METRYAATTGATCYAAEELLWVVAQVKLQIATVTGSKVEAMVLVQKDAPVDILLGTDLQPLLGFSLTVNVSGDDSCDLLQGSKHKEKTESADHKQDGTHQDETGPVQSTLRKEAPPFVPTNAAPPTSQHGLTV